MFSRFSRSARRPVPRGTLALSLLAGSAGAYAASVSGAATLASDDVWCGSTQSDSDSHGLVGALFTLLGGRQGGPGLELRPTAHDTDRAAERLFPDMAGTRFEAALQATF